MSKRYVEVHNDVGDNSSIVFSSCGATLSQLKIQEKSCLFE